MISALINTIFFLAFWTGHYHKTFPIAPETVSKLSEIIYLSLFLLTSDPICGLQAIAFNAVFTHF
jgi:hypothetical protein